MITMLGVGMKLDDLEVYQEAMTLGEILWKRVVQWDFLAKDTVGKQLIRSADSIAANISEGYGRCHYKENKQFTYYSRGSLYETSIWITKAHNRNLIPDTEYEELQEKINTLARRLNAYIKSIGPTNR